MINNGNQIRNKCIKLANEKQSDKNQQNIFNNNNNNNIIRPNIFCHPNIPNRGNVLSHFIQPQLNAFPNNFDKMNVKLSNLPNVNIGKNIMNDINFLNRKTKNTNNNDDSIDCKINNKNFGSPFNKNGIISRGNENNKTISNKKFIKNWKFKNVNEFNINEGINEEEMSIASNRIDDFLKKNLDFFNVFDCDTSATLYLIYHSEMFPQSSTNNYLIIGDNDHNNSIFFQFFIASILSKLFITSNFKLFDDHIIIDGINKLKIDANFSQYQSEFLNVLECLNNIFSCKFSSVNNLLSLVNKYKTSPPQRVLSFSRFICIYYRLVIINYLRKNSIRYNNFSFRDENDFKSKILDCTSNFFLNNAENTISILNKALNTKFEERLFSIDEVGILSENFHFLRHNNRLFLSVPNKYL
jgi:hypothetical protein